MNAGDNREAPRKLDTLLAGIEAGTLGGIVMLAYLTIASLWNGRSIWYSANLLATTFYGEAALRRGFRWMTMSGLAFHFFLAAVVGIAFAYVTSGVTGRGRVLLMGLFFGLAWYYLSFGLLWKHVNPLVPQYSPEVGMIVAHLLFGACLAKAPQFRRALGTA